MKEIKFEGNTFYVDDVTKALSEKYDPCSYKAPMSTIGEGNTEFAMGKLMFLARRVGEFVGVDFETYQKRYPNEEWYDSANTVHRERDLETYARIAEKKGVEAPVLRIENLNGKKIYFPTENLIKVMIKGIHPVPWGEFWKEH